MLIVSFSGMTVSPHTEWTSGQQALVLPCGRLEAIIPDASKESDPQIKEY